MSFASADTEMSPESTAPRNRLTSPAGSGSREFSLAKRFLICRPLPQDPSMSFASSISSSIWIARNCTTCSLRLARALPHGLLHRSRPQCQGLFSMGIRYGDLTHELAFTESSLRQIFRTLGFAEVRCYEDRPIVHGVTSLTRRVLWEAGSLPFRILYAAETSRRTLFFRRICPSSRGRSV